MVLVFSLECDSSIGGLTRNSIYRISYRLLPIEAVSWADQSLEYNWEHGHCSGTVPLTQSCLRKQLEWDKELLGPFS
jgi:hypothetical protein